LLFVARRKHWSIVLHSTIAAKSRSVVYGCGRRYGDDRMDLGFLRNHPLTFGLKALQLKHLGSLLAPVDLAAGDEILGEGIPAKGLFLLRSGHLRVTQKNGQKTESGTTARVLAELDAPTVVGEIELIAGSPSAATVTCTTAGSGALLSIEAFAELVDAGDAAVSKLLRNIARVLAQRLLTTNKQVMSLVPTAKQTALATLESDVRHAWNP
jgi:CRP/FNR family transcriptional regulator, cyclic AMP receptor protein